MPTPHAALTPNESLAIYSRCREHLRGQRSNISFDLTGRLVERLVVNGGKQALNALAIAYPGRVPEPL